MDAALTVFSTRGFARSSIEAIADAAGVSNRTIYNHFRDKADLFQVVIETSAALVADAQVEIVERHLGPLPRRRDVEATLIAFATEWTAPMPRYDAHRRLVEQVRAEVGHIPSPALGAWQRAGPARVRAALASAFARWAEAGLLRAADPDVAALHFTRLTTLVDPLHPGVTPRRAQAAGLLADAVHAFVHGYRG
jgi:AcrR family transcriptional regulator